MCPRTGSVSTPGLRVEEDWYVFLKFYTVYIIVVTSCYKGICMCPRTGSVSTPELGVEEDW